MRLTWLADGWDDYLWWQENDSKVLKRINELVKEIKRTPFTGTGKPEPLKGNFKGWWSRRINGEHRLVYKVEGTNEAQSLIILQCRYHYGD